MIFHISENEDLLNIKEKLLILSFVREIYGFFFIFLIFAFYFMFIVQVTGRKPTEEPNIIFKLQSDILSKISKMSSPWSNSSERNLSTVKKPSAQSPGLVILDFSNEKDVYRKQERSQVIRTKTLRGNSKGNNCNRASSFKNKS